MPDPYNWVDDGAFATTVRKPEKDSPTEPGQENSQGDQGRLKVFHSYQGASWIAFMTLTLSWVLSYQTLVALVGVLSGAGASDWGFFDGVSAWFADTMADLWVTDSMGDLVPYLVFSVGAVLLLDRKSRMGLRIGVIAVTVYMSGTWYAQNYAWYPDWAAWHGDWTAVQLVALFATATFGILNLTKMGDLRKAPQWRVIVYVLPASTVAYGILLTSTNAAF